MSGETRAGPVADAFNYAEAIAIAVAIPRLDLATHIRVRTAVYNAVLLERERCAQVAEGYGDTPGDYAFVYAVCTNIADGIRDGGIAAPRKVGPGRSRAPGGGPLPWWPQWFWR